MRKRIKNSKKLSLKKNNPQKVLIFYDNGYLQSKHWLFLCKKKNSSHLGWYFCISHSKNDRKYLFNVKSQAHFQRQNNNKL